MTELRCARCGSQPPAPGPEAPRPVCPNCGRPFAPAIDHGTLAPSEAGLRTTTLAGIDETPISIGFLAAPQQPDEIGRLGPYRVLGVLGAGGMGVVFRAEDPELRRMVALKAIRPEHAGAASRERFLREARAAAAVEHDNIVPIYQVGHAGGVPYLAMPLLKGETLEARLARDTLLVPSDVIRIGREVAEGLAVAHAAGLVHRDIKPANVWLEAPRGRVRVLDFGLATAPGTDLRLTRPGAVIGTPAFMAPEQALGRPVDPRADLFSLGCLLYRAGAGRNPFRGDDLISLLVAVVNDDPPPARDVNPAVPPPLSDLIGHLLAKNPDDRPATARAVADELAQLASASAADSGSLPSSSPGRARSNRAGGGGRFSLA